MSTTPPVFYAVMDPRTWRFTEHLGKKPSRALRIGIVKAQQAAKIRQLSLFHVQNFRLTPLRTRMNYQKLESSWRIVFISLRSKPCNPLIVQFIAYSSIVITKLLKKPFSWSIPPEPRLKPPQSAGNGQLLFLLKSAGRL